MSYSTNDGILADPPVASNPQPAHTPTSPHDSHTPHQIINDNSPQVIDATAPLQLGAFVLAPLSSGDEAVIHLSQMIATIKALQTTGYANGQDDVVIPDEDENLAPALAYQPAPEYESPQPQSPVSAAIVTDPEDISSQSSRPPSSMGPRPTSSLGANDDNIEPPTGDIDKYGMGTKEIPDWDDVAPVPALNKEYSSDYGLEMCIFMLDRVCSYLNSHRRLLRLLIQSEQVSLMYWEKLMSTLNLLNDGVKHVIIDKQMHLTTTLLPIKDMIMDMVAVSRHLSLQEQLQFELRTPNFALGHYRSELAAVRARLEANLSAQGLADARPSGSHQHATPFTPPIDQHGNVTTMETDPTKQVPTPHPNLGNGKGKQREAPPPPFDDAHNASNLYRPPRDTWAHVFVTPSQETTTATASSYHQATVEDSDDDMSGQTNPSVPRGHPGHTTLTLEQHIAPPSLAARIGAAYPNQVARTQPAPAHDTPNGGNPTPMQNNTMENTAPQTQGCHRHRRCSSTGG